jgi:hypothetical protein
MTDVPTLTSATAANYSTLNPLQVSPAIIGSPVDGNLSWSCSASASYGKIYGTMAIPSTGKYYWEVTAGSTGALEVGIISASDQSIYYAGNSPNGYTYYQNSGQKANNNSYTTYGASYTTNDVIGIAYDAGTGTLVFYKNNTSQGTAFSGLTGTYVATLSNASSSASTSAYINFGQRPFTYTPPTGYVALNTYNLPTSTITNGAAYMAASTYTGTGSSLTVSNAVGSTSFKPDLVWVKRRDGPQSHQLYDINRGVNQALYSNLTNAETTEANGLSAFTTSGFTVISDIGVNTSGGTYVGWNWKASNTTASNTNGSITSTVSAGATQGFSVVQFTATGATATVGHGLGVAPQMIIVKDAASAGNWAVWHTSLTSTAYYLFMNTTAAQANSSAIWTGTPSSTTFGIGSWHTADRQIAYCFAAVAGYSAFGSYTGNGSTDGTFVYLGFRPRFIMVKRTDTTGDWWIWDSSRNTFNVMTYYLAPNRSDAEFTANTIDFLSNGFKFRDSSSGWNASGGTYIYMAFAENPFRNSLAR